MPLFSLEAKNDERKRAELRLSFEIGRTRFEGWANTGVLQVTLASYTWSPSHDQRGMLSPFGTSLADL